MGAAAGGFASSLRGRKRRGKVGAGLPAEPWDLPSTELKAEEEPTEKNRDQESAVSSDTEEDSSRQEDAVKEVGNEDETTKEPSGPLISDIREFFFSVSLFDKF